VSLSLLASAPSRAADVFVTPAAGPEGASSLEHVSSDDAASGFDGDESAILRGAPAGTVLWHRHFEDPIYTSTGISEPAGLVFAGNFLNAPRQAEAVPILGDGTESWVHAGTEFFVDASRSGDVLAAVDFEPADSLATIMQFAPGSSTPLWTYVVRPCRTLTYQGWASRKPIQVSDDGSTIAAVISMYVAGGQRGRLFVFDAGVGTPVVDFDLPAPAGNAVATQITASGEFVATIAWPTIFVYDRYAQSLRWSGGVGAGNDALAISDDGRYLGWGWTDFRLREWNGSSYASVLTLDPPGTIYLGQCAFAPDGSSFVTTWDNGNTVPNDVWVELYELPSLSMLWSYDYVGAAGSSVDIPSSIAFSPAGERFAVGSWGGTFPEVHVFDVSGPDPVFTLDTPGSMFDVDIVRSAGGDTWVAACGKNVHAGQSGRGGDLYAIAVPAGATPAEIPTASPSAGLLSIDPNPFGAGTRLRYAVRSPGGTDLEIYDVQGRLVRRLVRRDDAEGSYAVTWDGRNDAGRALPSGSYFARLTSAGEVGSRRIVLIR
jgi:hypothetical protein